jgi:hypothetical protein
MQRSENVGNIRVDAHSSVINLHRAVCSTLVDAYIKGIRIFVCVLPERILDNDRGVLFIARQRCICSPLCHYISRLFSFNRKSKTDIIVIPCSFLQRGEFVPVMMIFLNESGTCISDSCS